MVRGDTGAVVSPSAKAVRAVRSALTAHGPLSRAELIERTGLARSTVARTVQTLLDHGELRETEPRSTAGRGRPPALVTFAGDVEIVGFLGLSHSELRAVVLTHEGEVVAERRTPFDSLSRESDPISVGAGLLDEAVADLGGGYAAEVSAIAFGMPGAYVPGIGLTGASELEEQVATIVGTGGLPDWMRGDPAVTLRERFGVPAVAENDANLMALGEVHFGAGAGASGVLVVKLVDGVGAGLVINGRLFRGAAGMAGEIAHVSVAEDGPPCLCGRRGCLAAVLATTALTAPGTLRDAPARLGDVFARAAFGDSNVLADLLTSVRYLGRVIGDLCVWLNPDAIVLAGLDEVVGARVIASLAGEIEARAGRLVGESTTLALGALGPDADVMGGFVLLRGLLASRA
ncbi:MAG: ROK family transcriptional regulator [Nocardioides sp.]|uniref:ROK family transcriptional regulator n=1 Tax=Nocardioides sp. TaxID=35761 RepID=UPI0039E44B1E